MTAYPKITIPSLALAALAGGLVLTAASAMAETGFRANLVVERIFSSVDRNADGKIDTAERVALREQRFARLDGNGDGAITKAEAEQIQAQIQARAKLAEDLLGLRLTDLDANADGAVTRAEFVGDGNTPAALFVDTNGDGFITRDEMQHTMAALPAFE